MTSSFAGSKADVDERDVTDITHVSLAQVPFALSGRDGVRANLSRLTAAVWHGHVLAAQLWGEQGGAGAAGAVEMRSTGR